MHIVRYIRASLIVDLWKFCVILWYNFIFIDVDGMKFFVFQLVLVQKIVIAATNSHMILIPTIQIVLFTRNMMRMMLMITQNIFVVLQTRYFVSTPERVLDHAMSTQLSVLTPCKKHLITANTEKVFVYKPDVAQEIAMKTKDQLDMTII